MAANTPEQRALTEFVKELGRRASFESDAAWARAANYPSSNLSELLAGKAGVAGANLVALIRAAAARIHESEVDLALGSRPRSADLMEAVARLEAVVGRLAALDDPPNALGDGQA